MPEPNAPDRLEPMPTDRTPDNVIWIFGDQHRAQALGYEGDPNLRTPNLDAFATEALLPRGVGGCPLCCPYRGSLLTSRYPHECVPGHEDPLPAGMPTIASAFADAGYETAWFGKWHLGGIRERECRSALATVPRELRGGFETWIGYDNNNSQYDSYVHGHDTNGEVQRYRLSGYETDALSDLLIAYIRGHTADQPFFAALSVQPPHDPYVAPERFMREHTSGTIRFRPNVPEVPWVREQAARELAGYYAAIENLDWNFGRIRQALDEAGLRDRTHIIFFSDHGDMHGSHGQFRKTNPYEESVRVPMMIGGGTPHYGVRRGRSPLLVNHVDIAPTSLGLCGLPVPSWMRGTDYSAARLAGRGAGPHGADRGHYPDSAYLQLVRPTGHAWSTDRPWRAVITTDGWKYACLEGQPWLMFNLADDPYEQVNLAHNTAFAAERLRLQHRLADWITSTGDDF